jgi:hypothetical protein
VDFFRPRLEVLEQRLYPGDALLGVWALTLWEQTLGASLPVALPGALHARNWGPGLDATGAAADALAPLFFLEDTPAAPEQPARLRDRAATASNFGSADGFDRAFFAEDALARSVATSPISAAAPVPGAEMPADTGAAWSEASASVFALAAMGTVERARGSFGLLAAARGSSGSLAFDAARGQLAIRTAEGEHTAREAISSDGFVDVTLDGQDHSSNPRSASFDRALAGATGATVAGIRFAGGSQDTLTLGSQQVADALTVQATGSTVVAENVATTGSLTIQAANITVNGAVQGKSVALAASGWITVNATGRIDTSSGRAGGVNSPSKIAVAADVFVNSGQLHADGASGGAINVQARNILNAGPITADSLGPGAKGGQVFIAFSGAYVATTAAPMSASSATGPAGVLTIDGGSTGRLFSSGRQQATGTVGGAVDLFSRDIVLAAATVDASGAAGGGSVRLGGDVQGRDPAVGSAQTVMVTSASTIRADAQQAGSGGRVIVAADQTTEFDGTVSARGGGGGGAGGFIDLSGRGNLGYGGSADASARLGPSGTFLLDPQNLIISAAPAGIFPQFNLINPDASGTFGNHVSVLGNGNIVVTNATDNFGGSQAGAAYLFDGSSGALVSSLVGSHPNDRVGLGVVALSNSNYVITSPNWNGNRGAVTWGNGNTGVSGTVSDANSLVGSNSGGDSSSGNPGDLVGISGITLLSSGNYVVDSIEWNGSRGAATWGNGSTGTSGTVSAANSLVGSNLRDQVGLGIAPLSNGNYVVLSGGSGAATWGNSSTGVSGTISAANSLVGTGGSSVLSLSNGNYVVVSPNWNANRGAVTWGDGSTGIAGAISAANSLVGSIPGDMVGAYNDVNSGVVTSVVALSDGNYVVASPDWNSNRGAATWGNGSTGVSGTLSAGNSLVGSNSGGDSSSNNPGDLVGISGIASLSNGNYVVASRSWNGSLGAATWGNGNTGTSGTVSVANSLTGSNLRDQVGIGVTPLSNGNYVVQSSSWNGNRGAATWGNGSIGTSGTVSDTNSLVGGNRNDFVGLAVKPLTNGNYVVHDPSWNGNRGAATWGNGSTGTDGTVSAANSLVGSNPGDRVGGVTPLSNGNYVVTTPFWDGNVGAVAWGNGSTGTSGTISAANSLVGSNPGDLVGNFPITLLSNGNYVVADPYWNDTRGAATWGDGSIGVSGTISAANSLVGSEPNDSVGHTVPLSNGNYVVLSPSWNGDVGAATWGNGRTGTNGNVSQANSLVGSNSEDLVGLSGITPLSNGNYVVDSPSWNSGSGAATWASGTSGQTLDGLNTITPQNSLVGSSTNAGLGKIIDNPIAQTFLAPFVTESGGQITAGFTNPSLLTYSTAQSQSLIITPDFLTGTLDSGTAVVLQASNDITVNDPISVGAGGNGGALTLQAGRNIVLNANVSTDNGALTLIANDELANGVVDAERDSGNAVITMAPSTSLDTGSGPLTVELRDGAGLTNSTSGAITLQTVTAGSVSVVNNGPSAGSDVNLGPVTTSGVQNYADPNGTTTVNGNLTATNPITFNDSVVVQAGVRVDAGYGTVNFAGSALQQLTSGAGVTFGNVLHNGSGTLQLTSGLAVQGTFETESGTFDANNQPVTVGGLTIVAGASTYLAGTAPQSLQGRLVILAGVFTSSTGPMSISGGTILTGGHTSYGLLTGVGTVDALTTLGGTLAPGGSSPGILSITGALALNQYTTVSILLNGIAAGTGYSQLQAAGPIDLGQSTLSLNLGFVPPVGSSFEILTNTGAAPITDTFAGLAEGAVFSQGGYQFQITYQGGTGSDSVVLTCLA